MKATFSRATLSIAGLAALLAAPPAAVAQDPFATIATFTNGHPSGLMPAHGLFYGTSSGGSGSSSNCGTVFELQPPTEPGGAWTQTVLHAFADTNDLCNPFFGTVLGLGGELYGVTSGGQSFEGTGFYELSPPASPGGVWTEEVLYTFGSPDSPFGGPVSDIIPGPDGSFHLLTSASDKLSGVLVRLQPPASPGSAWGAVGLCPLPFNPGPPNSLTAGPDGVFYVTLTEGQIVQVTPPSTPGGACSESVIYDIPGILVGNPNSLVLAQDGTLYGTAYGYSFFGGQGDAAVFMLTPPASPGAKWTYTLLANLESNQPNTPLILRNGNLYVGLVGNFGATPSSVLELQPPSTPGGAWTKTLLHKFTNGQAPLGNLVLSNLGTLYGLTAYGSIDELSGPLSGTIYAIKTQ